MDIKQAIEHTKDLSYEEKALLAHYLISSLENGEDQDVDIAWASLAEKRFEELRTGDVTAVSWNDIKGSVKE